MKPSVGGLRAWCSKESLAKVVLSSSLTAGNSGLTLSELKNKQERLWSE